jgi:hypothetical protein
LAAGAHPEAFRFVIRWKKTDPALYGEQVLNI